MMSDNTARKDDSGKLRYDLIPVRPFATPASVLTPSWPWSGATWRP